MKTIRKFLIALVVVASFSFAVVGCGALTEEIQNTTSSSVAATPSSEESFESTVIELPEESSEDASSEVSVETSSEENSTESSEESSSEENSSEESSSKESSSEASASDDEGGSWTGVHKP